MQFGVIYLETWDSKQPYIALSTLDFRSCFFPFGGTHTAPNSLTFLKPVAYCGGGGLQNHAKRNPRLRKLLKIVEFRMPTPQDVWKKGSKILKLPRLAIVFN